ncbi:MAG TPA: S-layer homology domain-containing protein [Leptolyngbyaceae cyanobacterium]
MLNLNRFSSASATILAFGLTAGVVAPIALNAPASAQTQAPANTQTTFNDLNGYWAAPFIQSLAARNIITGYPNGQYRPNQPVQRAEFAAMLQKAFDRNQVRQLTGTGFVDVANNYWATSAIQEAYETGFMAGFPGSRFYPNRGVTKAEAIVALANGLGLTPNQTAATTLSNYYTDDDAIPSYAVGPIAAATEANIVVNYPNVNTLAPSRVLTRGEAAALIHQALVNQGVLQPIANAQAANYIVGNTTNATGNQVPGNTLQNTAPDATNQNITPNNTNQNITPNNTNQNLTPNNTNQNLTPNNTNQNLTPNNPNQTIAPNNANPNLTPNSPNQTITPNNPNNPNENIGPNNPNNPNQNIAPNNTNQNINQPGSPNAQ